jgi:hypothetical protein
LPLIALSAFITALNANPILDDIIQYDVIFTAKYVQGKSESRYVVQDEIKGKITKPIMDRVQISARLKMDDNQIVIFKFWKNGSKEFGMETLDKKNRIRSWIKGKFHFLNIKDLIDAVNREKVRPQ